MIRRTHEFRVAVLGGMALAVFLLLLGRLWYVQVARGSEYTSRIRNSSQVNVRLPAVRGEILDRHGKPMVQNRASNAVEFYLPDMVRDYRTRFGKVPMYNYRTTVGGMMTEKSEPDIVRIVNEAVIPRLTELGLANDYNANALRQHFRNQTEVPFTYMEDLDFEDMAKFAENDVGLAGVNVTVRPVRRYVYGALASHLLGYVGQRDNVDKEEAANFNYYQPDDEGKAQLELVLDSELRGVAGSRVLQRNAKGHIEGEARMQPAKQGHNVVLTIDARIQYIAEKALRVVGRGAAVVVDPNTGDILAMVSVPSYDPNNFIPAISSTAWNELTQDATDPLINRALSAYAPGSTYKVTTSLAGLRAGVGDRQFNCSGGVQYGDKFMQCWIAAKKGAHGTVGLESAIRVSCNAFFYQYGNAAGIEQIIATGNMLGLGQKSGIPLSGESAGILPGPEWMQAKHPRERWSRGQTANTSIGQGYVLATPLQMAMVAATVANWGTSYYPRLVDKVVAQDGTVVRQEPVKIRTNLLENGLTVAQMDTVRRGMWDVVNHAGGTAGGARLKDYQVAGKTGTAQFWRGGVKDNHTWFICFAPYQSPRYAVAVLVQGALSGGGVAAPIAAKILSDT
ncbi:MAG: penicillin-binding protein 2, partial [Chthoniobacterales bacterium]|nr:penicillin-binding protein 2 [Chthoniobacterales bacterium]